jgi:DNA-binding response OmpR family regulator
MTAAAIQPVVGERILVVDDEPDIVALVVYHLAKAGYRVSSAAAGPDALQMARRERPSLIVLDLMLPGMSGFEILEQLRAASRGSRSALTIISRNHSARRSSCSASARSSAASAPHRRPAIRFRRGRS